MALQDKYINPFTDFGFKKLFGSELNKDLLIDFLNQVLPGKHKIKDLTYARTEQLGNTETDRKAIFDLYCIGENGERFIVEMQKAKQNFFKDRSVYYSSFPIQEQAKNIIRRGDKTKKDKAGFRYAGENQYGNGTPRPAHLRNNFDSDKFRQSITDHLRNYQNGFIVHSGPG